MVDILDEARDEFKQEQLIALFRQYAKFLAALFVLLLIAVAGSQWWRAHTLGESRGNSVLYFDALESIRAGNREEGTAKLDALVQDGSANYAALAGLLKASDARGQKDSKAAIAAYEKIADGSSDRALKDLATLLAADLQLKEGGEAAKDAVSVLDDISKSGRPWRFSAMEMKAFHLLDKKNYKEAKEIFALISTDPSTPAELRQRASDMLLYVAGFEK